MLHQGSGELGTVTGASLVRAHRGAREESYRLSVGLVGLEAMLRLFTEQERNPTRVRGADAVSRRPRRRGGAEDRAGARPARPLVPAEAALAVRVSAASDELCRVRVGGPARRLLAARPAARSASAAVPGRSRSQAKASRASKACSERLSPTRRSRSEAAREALRVITSSYEYHGGFRLRTVAARP